MFKPNFDQPGKGIDPDAPKKEGLALFVDIIFREFWSLLFVNLLFLICCLPVVTAGASFAALNAVVVRMIRDKPTTSVFYDFFRFFKMNFLQSTGIYALQIAVVYLVMVNFRFYSITNPSMHTPLFFVVILLSFINLYLIPVAVSVQLNFKNVLRNSVFLSFIGGKVTILGGVFNLVVLGLSVWTMPYSFPFYFLGGMSWITFINCFITFKGIERHCLGIRLPEEEEKVEKPATHEEEMARLDKELEALHEELEGDE